ncbi:MAG: DUF1353 domain-containing protein [Alphaproteobacteria bacterium]
MIGYDPQFPSPYPAPGWSEITDFEYSTTLRLCRAKVAVQRPDGEDANYIVDQPYTVHFKLDDMDKSITVPKGMLTDLSSVPPGFRWIAGRVGRHLEASIVHDYLYIAWQDLPNPVAEDEDRDFSDALMLVAMEAANVGRVRRFLIHQAVKRLGGGAFRGANPKPRYVKDEGGGDCPCEGAAIVYPAPPPPPPDTDAPSSDPDPGNAGDD